MELKSDPRWTLFTEYSVNLLDYTNAKGYVKYKDVMELLHKTIKERRDDSGIRISARPEFCESVEHLPERRAVR